MLKYLFYLTSLTFVLVPGFAHAQNKAGYLLNEPVKLNKLVLRKKISTRKKLTVASAQPTNPLSTSQTRILGERPLANEEGLDSKKLNASWFIALAAQRSQDALANQKTQTLFSMYLNADYDLTPFLNLSASPVLQFKNGNVQSDSATSGKSSVVELADASANLHYEENAQLAMGALNQSKNFSGLLVDNIAFPAAKLTFQVGSSAESFAGVRAQAAIPTSSSLTTNSRDYEKTPSFTMGGLVAQGKLEGWTIQPRVSYFEYKDLPTGVAADSGNLGNSVTTSSNSTDADFLYAYRGYEGGMTIRFDPARNLGFILAGQMVENVAAPKEFAQGSTIQGAMELWTGPVKWTPSYEYFKIAPDAAVAYYNNGLYQTNRVGYQGGLAMQYKRIFAVALKGGERDVVFQSATQSRERFYIIALETINASF